MNILRTEVSEYPSKIDDIINIEVSRNNLHKSNFNVSLHSNGNKQEQNSS